MSDINQSQCTPEGDKTPNLTDLFSENDNNSNSNRLDNIYLTWEQNENSSSNMNSYLGHLCLYGKYQISFWFLHISILYLYLL